MDSGLGDRGSPSLSGVAGNVLGRGKVGLGGDLNRGCLVSGGGESRVVGFKGVGGRSMVLRVKAKVNALAVRLTGGTGGMVTVRRSGGVYGVLTGELGSRGVSGMRLLGRSTLGIRFPGFGGVVSGLPCRVSSPVAFGFLGCSFSLTVLVCRGRFTSHVGNGIKAGGCSELSTVLCFGYSMRGLARMDSRDFVPGPGVSSSIMGLAPGRGGVSSRSFGACSGFAGTLFRREGGGVEGTLVSSERVVAGLSGGRVGGYVGRVRSRGLGRCLGREIITVAPRRVLFLSGRLGSVLGK